ncbi:hypothetical protein UPYG_G00051870 [Umbra pygmaea]|uniref:Alpha-2-macroglobulin-like n=1 Tax=Umbra pygmaea TaxID=75934 RepID=A0ABD0X806_UMBPY
MILSGFRVWIVLLSSCLCVCDETRPVYMVVIPAVIQAGSKAKVCASLLQPNEPLVMTITLSANEQKRTLLRRSSDREFHHCFQFQAPHVKREEVQNFQVEVRGETFLSTENRKIMIKPFGPMTFVQTDKPIYIPGHTVNFRIVTLDTNFVPVNQLYNIVELKDVNQNRIAQWVNTTSGGTILQLSHPLNSEAAVGSYIITVWIGEDKIHQDFKVEKYVLPKFEVRMSLANEINIAQKQYRVEVCATYTYGQPVSGEADLELCRPLKRKDPREVPGYTAPCLRKSLQMNQTGCASHVFNLTVFLHAEEKMVGDVFRFTAKIEEEGTGVTRSEDKDIALSYVIGALSFVDTPQTYEHGANIEGKIKVVHFNNTPISNMLVYLFEEGWPSRRLQNVTTNSRGIASFSLNTNNMAKNNINLILSDTADAKHSRYRVPRFRRGRHVISLNQPNKPGSKRPSSLTIQNQKKTLACGKEVSVNVQYAIVGETALKCSIDVMYLALSRGVIRQHGHLKVPVQQGSVTEGDVVLKLAVSPEMAPVVQLLVYSVLPSETVIAHSLNFPTEKCFRNKVSVEMSPTKAVPAENTTLTLSALPGSLCGLTAVDKSVYLMDPGKRMDADKVFNLLPVTEASHIPNQIQDPDECLSVGPRRISRSIFVGTSVEKNLFFQKLGLKLASNLQIRIPSCLSYRGNQYYKDGVRTLHRHGSRIQYLIKMPLKVAKGTEAEHVGVPPPKQTIRTFFPETWIWDLVEVGKSGSTKVSLTVPDTITSWETEAFCLAPEGFGLAPPVELTVFQPFFLELSLPYSIIRGERFELKATVFNYLETCIMVSVTPTPSVDYTLTPLNAQYSSCLCANGRKTYSWTMVPSILGVLHVLVSAAAVHSNTECNREAVSVPERGRVDTVSRNLLVKAEGTERTDTYNWLLCPRGKVLTQEVKLELPKNVVPGSARASLSVLGDIMGRALKNLDGLLKMPYGCGEQNIALLAPNVYILEYLKDTEQLTPAILEKATEFLTSGYQRQLNYKHVDGAYSTFGQGSGNTWLTAFVLRTFGRARSYIYIDPVKLEESKTWLGRRQDQHGCFKILGKLFNNRMKGGVADEVTMTAYVTASMLELNTSVSDPVVLRGLSCLRNSTSNLSNTYTTALLAYTFTLARDMEVRNQLLQHLKKISVQQGGLLHWTQTSTESSTSLAVETSSYVLLATLGLSSLSAADLVYASRIVKWLVRQQNAYGGFSSTQDTVVALQALALYSAKVYSRKGVSTVTVKSPSGGQYLFDVNQNNRLLYQERALRDTRGKYSIKVKGNACALVQLALHYNIPTPKNTILTIQVRSEVNCTSSALRRRVKLTLQSGYHGKKPATNMIIVDVKMLSGFVPDQESLTQLRSSSLVDRVDTKDDHVLMYLKELRPRHPVKHVLDIIEDHPVQRLKPAVVKLYDYYQPSDHAETEYIVHCK